MLLHSYDPNQFIWISEFHPSCSKSPNDRTYIKRAVGLCTLWKYSSSSFSMPHRCTKIFEMIGVLHDTKNSTKDGSKAIFATTITRHSTTTIVYCEPSPCLKERPPPKLSSGSWFVSVSNWLSWKLLCTPILVRGGFGTFSHILRKQEVSMSQSARR